MTKRKISKETQPIRDVKKIVEMKARLGNQRNIMLFTLGINTGLRIGDIVTLKTSDVKPVMEVVEQKTGKLKKFKLSDKVYNDLKEYIHNIDSEWLFPSRKYDGHISTVQAWRIIKKASIACGLEHIGTHSMRKTFGYHLYKRGVPLAYIMKALNHSSEAITLRYIGIVQEELDDKVYTKMSL